MYALIYFLSYPMLQKIDHINIVVTDLQVTTDFFVNLLGMKKVTGNRLTGSRVDAVVWLPWVDAEYIALEVPWTETKLELLKYYSPIWSKNPDIWKANSLGFRHMAFNVKGIEEYYEKIKEAWYEVFWELQWYAPGKKKLFYFYGPDQIILEMAEYM